MSKRVMSIFDACLYLLLKGAIIEDDDAIDQTVVDIHIDLDSKRIALKFESGDKRNVGINENMNMDIDNLSMEVSSLTDEVQIKPNKARFKKKGKKQS